MTANPHHASTGLRAKLPHPGVLLLAAVLALAGLGCWRFGEETVPAGNGASEQASLALRETAAQAREQYLRAAQQATLTRSRLLATQARLESFTRERYDELYQTAERQLPNGAADDSQGVARPIPPTAEQLEIERLRGRLTELGHERSRLLERYTIEHPLVRDVDSQIADVRRLIEAVPPAVAEAAPQVATTGDDNAFDRAAQKRLRRQWQGLIDDSLAGAEQIEQEYQQIAQELVAIEQQRAKSEKSYLASAEALVAVAQSEPGRTTIPRNWANVLFALAIGLPAFAIALRWMGNASRSADRVICQVSQIESWFKLPVSGVVAAGNSSSSLPVGYAPRSLPLVIQLLLAVLVFLLVAMTIQDPSWLAQMSSHPMDAVRHGLESLGGH